MVYTVYFEVYLIIQTSSQTHVSVGSVYNPSDSFISDVTFLYLNSDASDFDYRGQEKLKINT